MGCRDLFDGTLRIMLFGLNFATLMAGGVLLGAGIYVKVSIDNFSDIDADIAVIDVIAYLLIAVGLLVVLLSLMGCLGACLQNHVLLGCYFVLMLLLLLSEIGIGVLYAVEKGEIEKQIDAAVKDTVENYGDGTTPADGAVDLIQDLLKCCGYDSYTDYANILNLPQSCCEGEPTLCTFVNTNTYGVYQKGCKLKIDEFLKSQSVLVIIIVSAVALLEIITMLMACYLRKRELADIDYVIDNPPYSM